MTNEEKTPLLDKNEIAKKLEATRKEKRGKVKTLTIIGIVSVVAGIILWIYLAFNFGSGFAVIGGALVFAGMICFGFGQKAKMDFQNEARSFLTESVSKSLFPGCYFNAKEGFTENVVLTPGFFAEGDRFNSSDLLKATYDGITFDQCHYQLDKEVSSKNGSHYETYGQGTMYRFTFTRHFDVRIKIMERGTNANSKGLGTTQGITYGDNSLKKVETEYIDFNNKFEILSNDEKAVFYFLTPQMQEKIMSMETRFKGSFFMAFLDNRLYIAINNSDDSFKIPTNVQITADALSPVINLLSVPADFIEELHLDSSKYSADNN